MKKTIKTAMTAAMFAAALGVSAGLTSCGDNPEQTVVNHTKKEPVSTTTTAVTTAADTTTVETTISATALPTVIRREIMNEPAAETEPAATQIVIPGGAAPKVYGPPATDEREDSVPETSIRFPAVVYGPPSAID